MIKSNSQESQTTLSLAKENQKYTHSREGDFLVAEVEERTGKIFRSQDEV